jgi:riboflavin synthase
MDIAPADFYGVAMFTGLVEEVGTVVDLHVTQTGCQLEIAAPSVSADTRLGSSVAVNGCCLTVSARKHEQLAFDLLNETLERTNLRYVRAADHVNVERALRSADRLDGHFVQGHVDCTARIAGLAKRGSDYRLEIELPRQFARYVVTKGSIAVDGISLTIAEVLSQTFVTWIIPHTRARTNLAHAQVGDRVNLEFDILAKYVERLLQYGAERKSRADCSPQRIQPVTDRP